MVGNIPQEVSQSFMDGSLSAGYAEACLSNRTTLQYIIYDQQTPYTQRAADADNEAETPDTDLLPHP